jgi:hypothetical protein
MTRMRETPCAASVYASHAKRFFYLALLTFAHSPSFISHCPNTVHFDFRPTTPDDTGSHQISGTVSGRRRLCAQSRCAALKQRLWNNAGTGRGKSASRFAAHGSSARVRDLRKPSRCRSTKDPKPKSAAQMFTSASARQRSKAGQTLAYRRQPMSADAYTCWRL